MKPESIEGWVLLGTYAALCGIGFLGWVLVEKVAGEEIATGLLFWFSIVAILRSKDFAADVRWRIEQRRKKHP